MAKLKENPEVETEKKDAGVTEHLGKTAHLDLQLLSCGSQHVFPYCFLFQGTQENYTSQLPLQGGSVRLNSG